MKTLADNFDGRKPNFQSIFQENNYQTAIVEKWHLGHGENHDPTGLDYSNLLPDQGDYHGPKMIDMGEEKKYKGYVTDIFTEDRTPDLELF